MRLLVEKAYNNLDAGSSKIWLTSRLHDAIRFGSLALVRMLFRHGATVEMNAQEPQRTPLGAAAEQGQASIIPFLIDSGADIEEKTPEGETPLFLAVKSGEEEAAKMLLDAGADIYCQNKHNESIMGLAEEYPTILRMLSDKLQDGRLAGADQNPDVSQEFNARVVFFTPNSSGALKTISRGIPVSTLLEGLVPIPIPGAGDSDATFKWYHLPANNMRWVETLIFQHCGDRAFADKILKPDRWVGKQHRDNGRSHHARFMQPLCQSFGPVIPDASAYDMGFQAKDLVVFMPYLHWQEKRRHDESNLVLRNGQNTTDLSSLTKEQRLLHAYLFSNDPHPLHLLHIRRTLDQFCYYTLPDTGRRDKDQTVTRHQSKCGLRPEVIAMVDQLWLWILVGPSGQADTVITCFPTKDRTQAHSGADPDGFTDILQTVILHMLDAPYAVRSAYDLAGLITSTCSRTFLGRSRAAESLQFAEIYDSAISNIMDRETELFDLFSALTKYRGQELNPALEILNLLKEVEKVPHYTHDLASANRVKEHFNGTLVPDIPDVADVAKLKLTAPGPSNVEKAIDMLQKLGNFHVLDISREIALLREIKDIQDELDIMAMVFKDQANVMQDMERICRAMNKIEARLAIREEPGIQDPESTGEFDLNGEETAANAEPATRTRQASEIVPRDTPLAGPGTRKVEELHKDKVQEVNDDDDLAEPVTTTRATADRDLILTSHITEPDIPRHSQATPEEEPVSEIWGSSRDGKHTSLPLITLQLSIDDVDRMTQRAAKANQAVSQELLISHHPAACDIADLHGHCAGRSGTGRCITKISFVSQPPDSECKLTIRIMISNHQLDFLVDLKQKQSNVMDARSARIQAEESLKMTKENDRQGKTLMVFTTVTIVFLPLSFMAAFLAIDVTQFPRDEDGTISLGYVLYTMLPISAFISLSFIFVAFKAESLERMMDRAKEWFKKYASGFVIIKDPHDLI